MNRFKAKISILPLEQRRLWPGLRRTKDLGFVLYGGTAIALRLGHRVSIDFDFFTERPLDKALVRKSLAFMKDAEGLQEAPDTLVVSVVPQGAKNPVKISFFGRIVFGRFGNPELTHDGVLQVASLDDLMATKLKTILQRSSSKDYRDIAAMIAAGSQVSRGLAIAYQMFRPTFQPAESLRALTYHKDLDAPPLSMKERTVLINAAAAVRALPAVERLSARLAVDCDAGQDDDRAGPVRSTRKKA